MSHKSPLLLCALFVSSFAHAFVPYCEITEFKKKPKAHKDAKEALPEIHSKERIELKGPFPLKYKMKLADLTVALQAPDLEKVPTKIEGPNETGFFEGAVNEVGAGFYQLQLHRNLKAQEGAGIEIHCYLRPKDRVTEELKAKKKHQI